MTTPLDQARAVADAVLYEGYLLYPYRATSRKNQVRWQFGVIGPPGASADGIGEESYAYAECLVRPDPGADAVDLTVYLRFLHLQHRSIERADPDGFAVTAELRIGGERLLTWDEAVECETRFGPMGLDAGGARQRDVCLAVPAASEVEVRTGSDDTVAGRIVRTRAQLAAELDVFAKPDGDLLRLTIRIDNRAHRQSTKDGAIALSLIGAHALLAIDRGCFVSTVDPPPGASDAAARCTQHRWWPVLAGPPDEDRLLLLSPIILEDHAELAPQSAGALFDSTEIDEILTLRVMTLTDEEKAEARATDPRAAEIIDRCDAMSPAQLAELHGILRDPHGFESGRDHSDSPGEFGGADPSDYPAWTAPSGAYDLPDDLVFTAEAPWWDPEADARVDPESDEVVIDGVDVRRGSLVTVRPNRRADVHDIFFAGMTAKVAAVLNDVDGDVHVAVTLLDDPAAEMHEWYGRYLYFAPDELVPLGSEDPRTTTHTGSAPGHIHEGIEQGDSR